MVWIYTKKEKGLSVKDFFNTRYSKDTKFLDVYCPRTRQHGFREVYAVAQTNGGPKFCAVILTTNIRDPKGGLNFGYKDMDEILHPYYYNCPDRILDQLDKTTNFNALRWRHECRRRNSVKKEIAELTVDDLLVLKPMLFGNRAGVSCYRKVKRYPGSRVDYYTAYQQQELPADWQEPPKNLEPLFKVKLTKTQVFENFFAIHKDYFKEVAHAHDQAVS